MGLIAKATLIGVRTQSNKDQIFRLYGNNTVIFSGFVQDANRPLFPARKIKLHIGHSCVIFKSNTVLLQIMYQGKNQRFILVVGSKFQAGEVGDVVRMMDEACQVAAHLNSTVPVFEGKHSAPEQPEIRLEEVLGEYIGDFFIIQFLLWGKNQSSQFHDSLIGQSKLMQCVGILTLLFGHTDRRAAGVIHI